MRPRRQQRRPYRHISQLLLSLLEPIRKWYARWRAVREWARRAGKASADAGRMVFESLEPRILMSADLMPVSAGFSSSGSIYAGDSVSALMQVNRQGTDAIGVPVRIQFYASTDGVLDSSDASIGQVDVPASQLPVGTSTVTVPLDTSTIARPGSYRIIGVVDPANTIAESDENNNRVVSNQTLDLRFVVGQVPGHAAIPSITLTDADGTRFTLAITGPGTATLSALPVAPGTPLSVSAPYVLSITSSIRPSPPVPVRSIRVLASEPVMLRT